MLPHAPVEKNSGGERRIPARRAPSRDCTKYNNGGRALGGLPKIAGGPARVVKARPVRGGGLGG
jgi:hypothetical protein